MKTVAIIVAGGKGKRMGRPKQFIKINGKPILAWTIAAFQKAKSVDGIILVVAKEYISQAKRFRFSKLLKVVPAGKERTDSVQNGLKALPDDADIVAIHDGARPAITVSIIEASIKAAKRYGAVVVGVPVKDTIKQMSNIQCPMSNEGVIIKTIDRSCLWAAQTPQVFKKGLILKAYKKGYNKSEVTDDSMLVERLGIPVKMIMGSYDNIKVTTPEDLLVAEAILKSHS